MKFPRLGRGVMPAKKKGSKRQPRQRENIPWPVLDWTETAKYRTNLEETRRANLCEGRYERMLIAQAEFSAARARDAETSPSSPTPQSPGTRGQVHDRALPGTVGVEPRRRIEVVSDEPGEKR